jgi:uncharacterized membrane protein
MTGKRSTFDWIGEAVALAALLGMIGLLAANWAILPDRMPTHFGASGAPNAWGSKDILWVLMFANVAAYIVMTLASRYQRLINLPIRVDRNSPEVRKLLRSMTIVLKAVMMLLLLYIAWAMVQTGLGRVEGLGAEFLPVFLAATFLPLMLFLRRLRKFEK